MRTASAGAESRPTASPARCARRGNWSPERSRLGRLIRALALGLAACASPPLGRQGSITVVDGFALPAVGGGQAAFVTLRNDGATADTVVRFRSPVAASISLHRTSMNHGVAGMMELPFLVLEPRTTASMESGGTHLMLSGVSRELAAGDHLPLEIVLAQAGTMVVTLPVLGFGEKP